MNEYIQFFSHNWQLTGAFVALLVVFILLELRERIAGANKVSPFELTLLINHENAVVIDIRNLESYSKGHIAGSISCPAAELEEHIKKLKKHQKNKMIVVDANGQGTKSVVDKLIKQGFENVTALQGGIAAWQKAELPLKG